MLGAFSVVPQRKARHPNHMAKQDMNPQQWDKRPDRIYWIARGSLSTPEEREDRYQRYLKHSEPYFGKVIANGDEPWFTSLEERRELFMRRYQRPEPPASIRLKTLDQIRGKHDQPIQPLCPNDQDARHGEAAY